jgi:hypothetical protein
MGAYQTKADKLSGTDYSEIRRQAEALLRPIRDHTKRQPYVRSAYFRNDKIFIQPFWQHLWDKNWRERDRRLKFLPCALELIRHSRLDPLTVPNPNHPGELLHRFAGVTPTNRHLLSKSEKTKRLAAKILCPFFLASQK